MCGALLRDLEKMIYSDRHEGALSMSVRAFVFSPEFHDQPERFWGRTRKGSAPELPAHHVDAADRALVTRVRDGDEADARAAFDALYVDAYDRLVRFAMQLVEPEVAHDVVQDMFVSVWLSRSTWQTPAGSLPYFYSAVRNRALKRIRHEGVVARARVLLANPTLPSTTPDASAEGAEFDAALSAALAELPERRRTAFLLRAVDELGYDAIGAVLGISGPGAYKQVVAAVRTLRERLARFAG